MDYKTAIVHEWLTVPAGSEKVLEEIYRLYPSPIYTLVKDETPLKETVFRDAEIITSFIQRLPLARAKYRSYLPLYPLAIEDFDLSEYDVILSSSHAVAKGVMKRADQLHVCYCHTPMRYIWDVYHQYIKSANLTKGVKAFIAKLIMHYLRIWDVSSANRVDYFIANSKFVANRIKKTYGKEAGVIYPPVDVDRFEMSGKKEDYYLTASRMVPYKKIDLIVEAFSEMKDKRLLVIGEGPDYKKVKKLSQKNIELLGYQPFDRLKEYMGKAKAFVFAAYEDFGIMPVEAQAAGTPVIAYGRGGACETVTESTGLFFMEQTAGSIIEAVGEFEKKEGEFSPEKIRENALRFSKENFIKKYKDFIDNAIAGFKGDLK